MIAIVNRGGDMEGVCEYTLQVNKEVLATFYHNRQDGLAVCLERAATAYKREMHKKLIELIQQKEADLWPQQPTEGK